MRVFFTTKVSILYHNNDNIEIVIFSWSSISNKVLRCISMSFAERLLELDLSGSKVSTSHLDLLLVRCTKLEVVIISYICILSCYLYVQKLGSQAESLFRDGGAGNGIGGSPSTALS